MSNAETVEDLWLVRPCEMYKEEYSDCTSIRARFHQYFVFGETVDCSQWKIDFDNCNKWANSNDIHSVKKVVESEKKRRLNRLQTHRSNDTWTKRSEPPSDWNKPLPDWLLKEYKDSYLDHKAQEMRDESLHRVKPERTLCVLS